MGAVDMLSASDRQRRSRAHSKNDHSLCDVRRCDRGAIDSVTQADTPAALAFGPRGRRLWADLTVSRPTPAARVLIEEACRLADRLDRLDRILTGGEKEWMRLQVGTDGAVAVVLDAPLAEARQQATALKQILGELRQSAGRAAGTVEAVSIVDQLAARRADRLANATGGAVPAV